MATDIRNLDPEDPGYEAAVEAALRAEDEADGMTDPAGGSDPGAGEDGAAPAGEAEAGPAPTEAPAPPAAAPAAPVAPAGADKAAPAAGVLAKDGKTILPYAALKGARTEAREQRLAREAAEKRAEELQAQLDAQKGGTSADMRERAEAGLLTEQEREEYPALAKIEQAFEKLKAERAAPAAAATPSPAAPPAEAAAPTEDDVQEAIDSVPALAGWQAEGGTHWQRAVEHDKVLRGSPKWRDRPLQERFAHVAKLVADEFDEPAAPPPAPSPSAPPAPARRDPKQVAQAAARTAPNTLSDFKGGAPDPSTNPIERLPATAQVAKFSEMSDDEIDRHLARLG